MVWAEVPNPRHEAEPPSHQHVAVEAPTGRYRVPTREIPWFLIRTPTLDPNWIIDVALSAIVKPTALIDASQFVDVDLTADVASVIDAELLTDVALTATSRQVYARAANSTLTGTLSATSAAAALADLSGAVTLSATTFPIASVVADFVIDLEVADALPSRNAFFTPEVTLEATAMKVITAIAEYTPDVALAASVLKVISNAANAGVDVAVTASVSKIASSQAPVQFDVTADAQVVKVASVTAEFVIDVEFGGSMIAPVYARAADFTLDADLSATNERITFSNSGIQKSANQLVPDSTWTRITGWAVRSGFPNTIIEGDGIRVPAGVAINWAYDVDLSTTPLDRNPSTRLVDGITPVPDSTYGHGNYQDPPKRSGTYVGTGEIIYLEVNLSGTTARRTVTTVTYVEITRV